MNNLFVPTKRTQAHQQHTNADERHPAAAPADEFSAKGDSRWGRRAGSAAIVVLFWIAYFAGMSAMSMLENAQKPEMLISRAVVSLGGLIISFGMVAVQNRLQDWSLSRRAIVALLMALVAPVLHFFINREAFAFFVDANPTSSLGVQLVFDYSWRVWIWCAMSGIILAMSYAADIREREKRIRSLQALAHAAQLRALRNQLNPHFLFNALNSITGLISAKRVREAETMTENLADFLRTTLALDPQTLITLDEELRLQKLYLDIEQVRFPDRLNVKVDVPSELRDVLVPSLVTQPLIENSIKYAVARSTEPVELTISAQLRANEVEVVIADSGGDAGELSSRGAHMGLRNVAERVQMHYGSRARFSAEPKSGGGFRNSIVLPLRDNR